MSTPTKVIFFGSCYAGAFASDFTRLKKEGVDWTSDFDFESSKSREMTRLAICCSFFSVEDDKIVVYNREVIRHLVDPLATRFLWPWHPLVLSKPEGDAKIIYCFISPIMDYFFLWHYGRMRNNQKLLPSLLRLSSRALEEIVLMRYAHIFQFLRHVERLDIPMLLVEGPRVPPLSADNYAITTPADVRSLIERERDIVKIEMKKLHLPLVELPEELHDKMGFTQEKYRCAPGDTHINSDYRRVWGESIIQGLREYTSGRPKIFRVSDIPPPPSPHPATQYYDASVRGVVELVRNWEKAYADLRAQILQLQKRYKRLKSSLSWKMTAPVRAIGRALGLPKKK
jgi:hypothetical protein